MNMIKDPPPSYQDSSPEGDATYHRASHSYQLLATSEVDEDLLERGALSSSIRYELSVGSALVSTDPACNQIESLETLIKERIPPTPPNFSLEVKGFRNPSGEEQTTANEPVQAFCFSVPLPTPVSSTFYSISNDAPCLRGDMILGQKRQPSDFSVGNIGWPRSADASSKTLDQVRQVSALTPESADSTRNKWNNRVKKSLSPPWSPLSEPVRPKTIEDLQVEGADLSEATSSLRDCLKGFAEDRNGSSRWLIGPQSIFGWDLGLLMEELNCLVESINSERGSSSRQTPITHLDLQISSPPPFFALHYQPQSQRRHVIPSEITSALSGLVFFLMVLLPIFWLASALTSWWTILFLVCLLGSLFAISAFGDLPAVHDSIGLAWSMKRWVKTGFSAQMAKKEVQDRLGAENDGHVPRLRLMEDGWFKFVGMEESDWVEANREGLKAAIRNRRSGNLTVEWPGGSE